MQTPTSPSIRSSATDSTIRAYAVRGWTECSQGIGQVVAFSSELIGLTYQVSRVVIRISAFVFSTPRSTRKPVGNQPGLV